MRISVAVRPPFFGTRDTDDRVAERTRGAFASDARKRGWRTRGWISGAVHVSHVYVTCAVSRLPIAARGQGPKSPMLCGPRGGAAAASSTCAERYYATVTVPTVPRLSTISLRANRTVILASSIAAAPHAALFSASQLRTPWTSHSQQLRRRPTHARSADDR